MSTKYISPLKSFLQGALYGLIVVICVHFIMYIVEKKAQTVKNIGIKYIEKEFL